MQDRVHLTRVEQTTVCLEARSYMVLLLIQISDATKSIRDRLVTRGVLVHSQDQTVPMSRMIDLR